VNHRLAVNQGRDFSRHRERANQRVATETANTDRPSKRMASLHSPPVPHFVANRSRNATQIIVGQFRRRVRWSNRAQLVI
jgi:hypothetical protein